MQKEYSNVRVFKICFQEFRSNYFQGNLPKGLFSSTLTLNIQILADLKSTKRAVQTRAQGGKRSPTVLILKPVFLMDAGTTWSFQN